MEDQKEIGKFYKRHFYYNEEFVPEVETFKKFILIDKKLREEVKNPKQIFSIGMRNAIKLYNRIMKSQIEREANANTTN